MPGIECVVAVKSAPRGARRAGGHLDSAVDFAIVLVMLLLDLFNPRPVREAALLLHLDSDSDLHGQREHGRNHYSLGRTHLRRAFCTFSKLFGGVWGESWALGFGVREVWGGELGGGLGFGVLKPACARSRPPPPRPRPR